MGFNRRDFLKLLGSGTVAALTTELIAIAGQNQSVLFGLENPGKIESRVPDCLKNEIVPVINENWRKPEQIFQEAFAKYEELRKRNGELGQLKYVKPRNFIDATELYSEILKERGNGADTLYENVSVTLKENDIPYSSFFESARNGIVDLENMIVLDPGTGIVNHLREVFSNEYDNSDLWDMVRYSKLSSEQSARMSAIFTSWFDNAKQHFTETVKETGKKVGMSDAYYYFLVNNNGDVMRAVWDAELWFEVAARNDLPDLPYNPTRDKAEFLAATFKDEMSLNMSIDWLYGIVKDRGEPELWISKTEDVQDKLDYMLINRVGGFYHWFNIVALAGCMTKPLLRRMVAVYIRANYYQKPNGEWWSTDGREKGMADEELAKNIDQVMKQYEIYQITVP